ncbi:MAG: hypothetical protein HZA46_22750, partial [Planctomycetales bacterium]|nr:hypothetical protein [Planctomycetales bacterium]
MPFVWNKLPWYCLATLVVFCGRGNVATAGDLSPVKLVRTPEGGIQPQAVVDADGSVHLIYFKGQAGAGDLFYTKLSGSDLT